MPTEDIDRIPVAADAYSPPPLDGRDRAHPIAWEWWDAIAIYLVWTVLSGAAAFGVLGLFGDDADGGLAVQILLTLLILIATTCAWVAMRGAAAQAPRALRRLFGVKRVTGRDLLLGVAYGVGAFVVVQVGLGVAVTELIQALGEEVPDVQQEVQQAVQGIGISSLAIAFAVAVLAPIGEELLFRGVLYQGLAKHLPGWPAMGLSGLAFGLTHLEPLVIVLTFPLGMALAWMLRRHGTLVIPIIAHAVFNIIGVALIRGAG